VREWPITIHSCRRFRERTGMASSRGHCSIALGPDAIASHDAVLIVTNNDCIDYAMLVGAAPVVVDTRNATHNVRQGREKVFRA
jgi:UDP-N-acetyl-D-glucosamine dehydrogenase